MATSIPSAAGVPGISGPPNWLGGAGVDLRLDDVRWRGAIKRTFGSGGSGGDFVRATQAMEGADQFIYLTFRAGFAQQLDTAHDVVWLGLMKNLGATSIVIRIQVHPAGFDQKGPPSANPLGNVQDIQVFTPPAMAGQPWNLEPDPDPTWINANARYWLQDGANPMNATDPNSRWAVQLKIKAKNAGTLLDNDGPNIGTSFHMWYVMRGSVGGSPTILAEFPNTMISPLALNSSAFPVPPVPWELYNLTAGAATSGGVALYWGDVLVQNAAYGTGWTIDNGQPNTFICRPRNYSSAQVDAQNINATFRIANWGSVAGDPNQINFNDSEWAYVPGNSQNVPVQANQDIPAIPAGTNPPATSPISLPVPNMTLPAGKSKHQCILCTMSGANTNFLNESIYQNMNYDTASLLTREAEISIASLKPFSPAPRDVYLALEKINMVQNTPGTNEGRFLEASFKRAMEKGGELADKLKKAQGALSDVGDNSAERLEGLLNTLNDALLAVTQKGIEQLDQLLEAMRSWLLDITNIEPAAKRLAKVLTRLADFLEGDKENNEQLLSALRTELNKWLSGAANDPATLKHGPGVFLALKQYNDVAFDNTNFSGALDGVAHWLANPSPSSLPPVVDTLIRALSSFSGGNEKIKAAVASFARDVARWLSGSSRLEILVDVLSEAGLTEEELDQLFPTFRIHVYHDTGFRDTASDGTLRPILKAQSSFGLYVYHEGSLEGWQTAIEGAQRIEDNLYLLSVPNEGSSKIKVKVQAVEEGDDRMPEDPIRPRPEDGTKPGYDKRKGCLYALLKLFGFK